MVASGRTKPQPKAPAYKKPEPPTKTEEPPQIQYVLPPSSKPMPPASTAKKDVNYYKKVEQAKKLVKNCIKDGSTSSSSVKKWIKELEEALELLNSLS